jgi:hypothetical protein
MLKLISVVAGISAAVLATAFTFRTDASAPAGPPVPVVVELFTSEGCSSCPPADRVLTDLISGQPIAGARIIGLGEHVDYWDSLGWRDPFSQAAFSARQSDYDADVFRSGQIYTPQMVVNGRREFVGSSMAAARRAIQEAARETEGAVNVSMSTSVDPYGAIVSALQVAPRAGGTLVRPAEIVVAIVEDGLVTNVRRGENAGQTLTHSAVVRRLDTIGAMEASSTGWSGDWRLTLDRGWKRDRLQLVAFVQERTGRRILGAAAARLDPASPAE